jgi:hypothetical protein
LRHPASPGPLNACRNKRVARMTDHVEVNKASVQKEFPAEDPIVDLPIYYVCLQLIAFNLLGKTAKILMKALGGQK